MQRRSTDRFAALAGTVDPDDPWSHPDAVALDRLSVMAVAGGDRRHAQRPSCASRPASSRSARGSYERTLAARRCSARARSPPARGSTPTTSGRTCGSPRDRPPSRCGWPTSSATGSGSASPVRSIKVGAGGCAVSWSPARSSTAPPWSAPCRPARSATSRSTGVSDARLESLHRQRHALAAKFVAAYDRPFWRDNGQNGLTESEGILGSSWPQSEGILSCLVPPERIATYLSTAPAFRQRGGARRARRLVRPGGTGAGRHVRTAVGHRPVDPGLRHALAARRRPPRRPAARHPRAALLRLRLRPVGRRLHGGRGAHRPRRGPRSAGPRMTETRDRRPRPGNRTADRCHRGHGRSRRRPCRRNSARVVRRRRLVAADPRRRAGPGARPRRRAGPGQRRRSWPGSRRSTSASPWPSPSGTSPRPPASSSTTRAGRRRPPVRATRSRRRR